jgi:predicted Zn-ribbon and HTH transcriptional regulator
VKKDQGNITDDLLVKYLLRESSASEDQQVQEWVKESRENKDHLDQLRLIWNQSKSLSLEVNTTADEAWERFSERIQRPVKMPNVPVRASYSWVRIAAILIVLAGGGGMGWLMTRKDTPSPVALVKTSRQPGVVRNAESTPSVSPTETTANSMQQEVVNTTYLVDKTKTGRAKENGSVKNDKATAGEEGAETFYNHYRTNDFVCNGTPCPLEICIIQTIKCPGSKPSAVASCSTLLPDQSGQLRYKASDRIAENCKVTVQQIRIKRVTTGETIVLDENSKPSTAEELFNYITGRKKGNILAGMFHADCNNNNHEHSLKLDNNFGNLVLQ